MTTINVTQNNFPETIGKDGIVLLDCWASWCSTCKAFTPIFERTATNFTQHRFGKIDAQREKALISELDVAHIPTLLVYRDGILLLRQAGTFSESQLDDIIGQAESVDMEEVVSHLEKEKTVEDRTKQGATR